MTKCDSKNGYDYDHDYDCSSYHSSYPKLTDQ